MATQEETSEHFVPGFMVAVDHEARGVVSKIAEAAMARLPGKSWEHHGNQP